MNRGLGKRETRLRHSDQLHGLAAAIAVCSAIGSAIPMSSLA